MPQPTPGCKEHCKTCEANQPENGPDNKSPYCMWWGEEIEDEENETCFEWDKKEHPKED